MIRSPFAGAFAVLNLIQHPEKGSANPFRIPNWRKLKVWYPVIQCKRLDLASLADYGACNNASKICSRVFIHVLDARGEEAGCIVRCNGCFYFVTKTFNIFLRRCGRCKVF